MKHQFIILLILCCLPLFAIAQEWEAQISGTTETLLGVDFINDERGWAVGFNGTLLHTSDGGETWTPQISNTPNNLYSINFVSEQRGWATGAFGKIIHTTNGGEQWLNQVSGTTNDLNSVYFVDNQRGWVVGTGGTILHTTNGGTTWTPQSSGVSQTLWDVTFIDSQTGWISGAGGQVLHTTNGGTTWIPQASGVTVTLYGIDFNTADIGWAVGSAGTILYTNDGGTTWEAQESGVQVILYDVSGVSPTTAWACGFFGTILFTDTAGLEWTTQPSNTTNALWGLDFINIANGWAVGGAGTILRYTSDVLPDPNIFVHPLAVNFDSVRVETVADTLIRIENTGGLPLNIHEIRVDTDAFDVDTTQLVIDAGRRYQLTVSFHPLEEIDYHDTLHIFSNDPDQPVITVPLAGRGFIPPYWRPQTTDTFFNLNDILFLNERQGWAVGETILRTTDGGQHWEGETGGLPADWQGIAALDSLHLWVVARNGEIQRSIDGGESWSPQTSGTNLPLWDIDFVEIGHGWIVGANGLILHTEDAGRQWQFQASNTNMDLYAVDFIDDQHGWICGEAGLILSTTDGGNTWTPQSSFTDRRLNDIQFANSQHGWTVGQDGVIVHTTNGGQSWIPQTSGVSTHLNGIAAKTAEWAWVVGQNGTTLRTEDSGFTWLIEDSGITSTLRAVSFPHPNRGWTAGDGGTILYAENLYDIYTAIEPNPETIDFGDRYLGELAEQTFSVTNTGNLPLRVDSIELAGATEFSTENLSFTLLPEDSRQMTIQFYATEEGIYTGTIQIHSNAENANPLEIAVTANAAFPPDWQAQESGVGGILYAVDFIDDYHGWTVGLNGTVLHTTNGGTIWSAQNSGSNRILRSVFFESDQNGWIAGTSGEILRTTDGGQNWIEQNSGISTNLYDLHFVNATEGWAVGAEGIILHTSNGGETWSPQNSPVNSTLWAVDFVDVNRGWAVGDNGIVLSTINAGQEWLQQTSTTIQRLRDVDFFDENFGWIVGDQGVILHTINGGVIWHHQDGGTQRHLTGISVATPVNLRAVGFDGTILRTDDGGEDWIPEVSGTFLTFWDVDFPSISDGWAVGFEGMILNYSAPNYPQAPVIQSIMDVGNDQGRQVRLTWERSVYDGINDGYTITSYDIWRRVDAFRTDWDFISTIPAVQSPTYSVVAPTLADSTRENGIYWSIFKVVAHTANPYLYFTSVPDSGYSIDNLAPHPPQEIQGGFFSENQSIVLTWQPSPDADFDYYTIYRGLSPDITPHPAWLYAVTSDSTFMDSEITLGETYYYLITAYDFAGNESDPTPPVEVRADNIISVDDPLDQVTAPQRLMLHQNYPNPFNPQTTIRFDVPQATLVSLAIYNVQGALVRTLVGGRVEAGYHQAIWDGTNDSGQAMKSGVYFYRLDAGVFSQTHSMVLLR